MCAQHPFFYTIPTPSYGRHPTQFRGWHLPASRCRQMKRNDWNTPIAPSMGLFFVQHFWPGTCPFICLFISHRFAGWHHTQPRSGAKGSQKNKEHFFDFFPCPPEPDCVKNAAMQTRRMMTQEANKRKWDLQIEIYARKNKKRSPQKSDLGNKFLKSPESEKRKEKIIWTFMKW